MHKKHSKPHQKTAEARGHKDLTKENERKISGSVHVEGKLETSIPEDLLRQHETERKEDTAQAKKNRRIEISTLVVISIYTAVAALQWFAISKQADSAERANKLLEAQILPYLVVQHLDLAGPILPGQPTKITNSFVNEGGSVALEVQNKTKVDYKIDGTTPDYDFKVSTGSRGSIGAKEAFDIPPMALRPLTTGEIDQIRTGAVKIYVSGLIIYSDFRRTVHHSYWCRQYDQKNELMVGCPQEHPSD
jgi:hypothetical protein